MGVPRPQPFPCLDAALLGCWRGAEGRSERCLGSFPSAEVVNADGIINKGATPTGLVSSGLFQFSEKLARVIGRHFLVEKCCFSFTTSGLFLLAAYKSVESIERTACFILRLVQLPE